MNRAPTIHFVGHASFAVEGEHAVVLADPWLTGTAFNDGWAPMSRPRLDDDLRARVTDIYISHEHPDHFSPASLRQFAAPHAPTIRIRSTRDGRIATYCRTKGFPVTELPPHERVSFAPGFDAVCGPHRHMDSWLLMQTGGMTLLNINDCRVNDAAQALRIRSVTWPVDVLFTQFSYANWVGNPDDVERRRAYADLMLRYVRTQIEIFEPRYVVPFASFVRFCHAENAYLGEELPRLGDVVEHIRAHTDAEPVALYPGDVWTVGEALDNEAAIKRYDEDATEAFTLQTQSRTLSIRELSALANEHILRLRDRSNRMVATRALEVVGFLPPVRIHLWDIDRTVEFRCNRGLRETTDAPHIEMGTDSLAFCFEQDFGAETLYVNGRYRIVNGPEKLFFRHFYPAILNNQGYSFPLGAVQFVVADRVSWRLRAARERRHVRSDL